MTKFHVVTCPADENGVHEGRRLGFAETVEEAIQLCESYGYTVIREDDGGLIQVFNPREAIMNVDEVREYYDLPRSDTAYGNFAVSHHLDELLDPNVEYLGAICITAEA